MRTTWSISLVLVSVSFAVSGAEPAPLDTASLNAGPLPTGWTAAKTGTGEGSIWEVVADDTAPGGKAIAQTSPDGPNPLFNLCIADEPRYTDIDLTVSLKAIAGKIDQGGGPLWRCSDANNYYIARVNPLENNYRVYKVVEGKRTQMATANVKAPADKWHTLRIVHRGAHLQCYLNDTLHLEVEDNTFRDAGNFGLWTKADAQTRFAGLKVIGK